MVESEKRRLYRIEYRKKNREIIKQKYKEWRNKNLNYDKEYRERNIERIKQYKTDWVNKNREHIKKYYTEYRKENPNHKKTLEKQRGKYPIKLKARNRTNGIFNKLNWDREDYCLDCGRLTKLETHHISYKPNISVFGFCVKCHTKIEGVR